MWNFSAWYRRLQHRLDRRWYVPAVAVIAALNAFLPFIPVEIFVVLRVLIRPREWWRTPVIVAAASAAGAVALALVVGHDPQSPIAHFLAERLGQASWDHASAVLRQHGALGLALVSISFIPQQPAVVIGALASMPLWKIALPIWLARSLKYGFYSALAAFAPHWMVKAEHYAELHRRRRR